MQLNLDRESFVRFGHKLDEKLVVLLFLIHKGSSLNLFEQFSGLLIANKFV